MIYIILTLIIKYNNKVNSLNKTKYHLNDFTLFNNYGAIHLINNKSLLKSESVK